MLIIKETSGKVLAKSESALISVGREEDNTICINVDAISGYHGIFFQVDKSWIYRDNFSTNGSFLNGIALRPGQARLVKNGDLIRLANHTIQCELKNITEGNKILVLNNFEAVCTFSLPEVNSSLEINSSSISGYNEANLTFSRSETGVLSLVSNQQVIVNSKPHTGQLTLIDQDQIEAGEYVFLVCYTALLAKPARPPVAAERDYDPSKKMAESGKQYLFGSEKKVETSGVVKVGEFRAEMSMSQRLATIADDEASTRKRKIENAYAAFGVVVFFTSIAFVVFALSLF